MPKKDPRRQAGPRIVPAHWRAPEVTTAPATNAGPATSAFGPCWASRIDFVGSQVLILSRPRPSGSLSMVSAVVNEVRGLVDGAGDFAIGRSRLETMAAGLSGPAVRRAYAVPPEYVRFRAGQGEAISRRREVPLPQNFLRWRHLLHGVDDTWTPNFAAASAGPIGENRRPDVRCGIHGLVALSARAK